MNISKPINKYEKIGTKSKDLGKKVNKLVKQINENVEIMQSYKTEIRRLRGTNIYGENEKINIKEVKEDIKEKEKKIKENEKILLKCKTYNN